MNAIRLEALLQHYHALESVDARNFQPRARLLQSIWRDEQGYEPTTYRGKIRGARLPMPWAKETLANYLTDTIRGVARATPEIRRRSMCSCGIERPKAARALQASR